MAKIIFTSDWQMAASNLESCQIVTDDICALVKKHNIDAVIHNGDFKEHYDPLGVRVLNAAVDTCTRISALCRFDVLLGNHDRIGLHNDAANWFPALRAAGAHTFDSPDVVSHDYGVVVSYLPFCLDHEQLCKNAKALAAVAKKHTQKTKILVFHETINGCKFSQTANANEARVRPQDLCPDIYDWCIGGDVHMHQNVTGNIWYTGSPFAVNWGEANQLKGYILLDTATKKLQFIKSPLLPLLDETWPGFKQAAPKGSWENSMVRIHVPCAHNSADVPAVLNKARLEAAKNYPNAKILAIPEFIDLAKTATNSLAALDSDEERIKAYVKLTCPEHLQGRMPGILKRLTNELQAATGPLRSTASFKFKGWRARNFQSFKQLDFDLPGGIVLITGENHDWQNRSNGAGKSTFLTPPAVALFGKTFKGQTADKWATKDCKLKATVELIGELADSKECTVTRGRFPTKLQIDVDGADKTSSNLRKNTEEDLSRLTGYTWQTLANVVYLDQSENVLLSGTDATRREMLAKFQNLERYAVAYKSLQVAHSTTQIGLNKLQQDIAALEARRIAVKQFITQLLNTGEQLTTVESEHKVLQTEYKTAYHTMISKRTTYETQLAENSTLQNAKMAARDKQRQQRMVLVARRNELQQRMNAASVTDTTVECPTCLQQVNSSVLADHITEWQNRIKLLTAEIAKYTAAEQQYDLAAKQFDISYESLRTGLAGVMAPVLELKNKLIGMELRLKHAKAHAETMKSNRGTLAQITEQLKTTHANVAQRTADLEVCAYGMDAMSKHGLPAYLNAQLIPRLNAAAGFYSTLLADKEIQVVFSSVDGSFDIDVVNTNGGAGIKDQSTGEMKIASLITSFALRDVAAKTNLLILDEPGDGLDSHNAKNFATGLRQIAGRFGTVLVTSHNPTIIAELSGEHHLRIVKKNGVSTATFIPRSV